MNKSHECFNWLLIISISICLLAPFSCDKVRTDNATYYVDSWGGDDGRDGKSSVKAWRSLKNVNTTEFLPGDSILFKCNGIWSGQLWPKGSGKKGSPIVISKYSQGNLPIFNGEGKVVNTVYLYNQEYWELHNLEITNYRPDDTKLKRGIFILAEDFGVVHHLHINNLNIHDVNGDMSTRKNGGIILEIIGSQVPTWFDDVLIENCIVRDVDRIGINNFSSWMHRTLDENINWHPSLNIVVRNNFFQRCGGNALIIRVADRPIFEHNIFKNNGVHGTGNSNYTFNCDNALIQFNEAYLTHYTKGTPDGGGFNSDWRCKNTVIQYNYSHDNEHGGQLICNDGGVSTSFNDGTIVRYNVYQNNGHHVFRVAGTPTNVKIYNNTIYVGSGQTDVKVIWHKDWGGFANGIAYYNNIFHNLGKNSIYDFGESTNNIFDHNMFSGIPCPDEPADANKIITDPQFVEGGSGQIGWDSVKGYQLSPSSPAIDAGIAMSKHTLEDYFENPVPFGDTQIDIGAFEYQGNRTVSRK